MIPYFWSHLHAALGVSSICQRAGILCRRPGQNAWMPMIGGDGSIIGIRRINYALLSSSLGRIFCLAIGRRIGQGLQNAHSETALQLIY